jgi:hypothetical protein
MLDDLVDHVVGIDPDRDRITAAVVCAKTQGELDSTNIPCHRPRLPCGAAMGRHIHGGRPPGLDN